MSSLGTDVKKHVFLDGFCRSEQTVSTRSYALDFLKILATIGIVFHHFQQVTYAVYDEMINFISSWFYWGNLVELFFVLSGFFIYKYVDIIQSGKMTFSGWYVRRAKRLLPMVAVSAVAYELIITAYAYFKGEAWYGYTVSIWGTIITTLGIQEGWVFSNPYVNYPVWYISVLLSCYLWFYVLTSIAKKLRCSPIYFYVFMVLLGCGILTYGISRPMLNGLMARGYYSFFFGILISHFIHKYGITRQTVCLSGIVFLVLTIIFIKCPEYVEGHLSYILTFLMYPAIIVLLQTNVANKIFRHKFWGVLGQISFEVYLWHNPMLPLMYTLMAATDWNPDFSKISTMYLFLLASFGIGTICYYLLEVPLNRFVDKKIIELKSRALEREFTTQK